jgi:hypothetical protein
LPSTPEAARFLFRVNPTVAAGGEVSEAAAVRVNLFEVGHGYKAGGYGAAHGRPRRPRKRGVGEWSRPNPRVSVLKG